jgi:molybdenum cofactor cytidylyltransferase
MVSAIVLAAGESRRMGQPKQLLQLRGKFLLQHVLTPLWDSPVDEVLLVLGYEAEKIMEALPLRKTKIVINPDYRQGMSSSLRRGLMAMDGRARAFLVVLGDQPGITREVVEQLIHGFQRIHPEKNIVLPTYRGSRGHPVLIGVKYLQDALCLQGDIGCRPILTDHPEDILEVEVSTDAVLKDIDTVEDFKEYLKKDFPESPR